MGDDHHPILDAFLQSAGPLTMTGPLAEALKGQILAMDPEAGTAVLAFDPGDQVLQTAGVIQGGIVAAMLDFAMALAAFSRLAPGKSFGTVSLTTNFLKPALPGRHLARARLDRMGARMIFASSELSREGSEILIATASAVMAISDR